MNSPATFQTMMNHLLRDLINKGKVAVYLDNILIFTKDLLKHCEITGKGFSRYYGKNKLYLKTPRSASLRNSKWKYLGMIIGHRKVQMDPKKVTTVVGVAKNQKNKKEVQQFLGFANYYRHFSKGFSRVVKTSYLPHREGGLALDTQTAGCFEKKSRSEICFRISVSDSHWQCPIPPRGRLLWLHFWRNTTTENWRQMASQLPICLKL